MENIMLKLHIIALVIATLSGAALNIALTSEASACPRGYAACGGACCPGR
jgi:hypothetical protein